ncbi:MAG: hypothetical protein KBD88_06510, partial [Aliarcobacter sp.]|nr:hypothetical protein [Aliarcobacter sp.]
AVYYFSNLKLKEDVIRAQNQIEAYGVNKARAYDKITKQIELYCKNRAEPDTDVGVRPDAKTEFNRTVKRS